ncbi:MAG: alpha-L-rhamnosidase [Sphingomonas sanxanigenens]|uniref:Alpha-L-rhamnosidase n=1 Tax=Sphingomonas sanxanigenens TaxID=397260 RepID=A0A2W5AC85_9SPHN|nr:MAG: alpha-L-rhamnosidase [Sphingomonas sanxanigenens]
MDRRSFLASSAVGLAAIAASRGALAEQAAAEAPVFRSGDARWQAAYDKALAVLAGNVQVMPYISAPVLIEGSVYRGIWQECGPHEALVWRKWRPDVALNSHMTFFELQRADGQLPANNKVTETSFGQIQMVVPIAATAWELARATGNEELLVAAYRACAAWDGWLMRYRNTRGAGLIEGFCTYDTGHDNSPRWAGLPNQCPNKDARRHAPIASLPRLCPDLSATVFGARRALAAMAKALGRDAEAQLWTDTGEMIRKAIIDKLYVAEDGAFYDLDAQDNPVRIRGDVISRVCGEHVVDQATFDTVWAKQLGNPNAFWTPYPLPSIAADDPQFVRPIPANSWGGATQALTAMRAGRWFDHYGRAAEFALMMDRWCEAIQVDPSMRQQIDPQTGAFTHGEDHPDYSPCALVMIDYSWRLIGVTEEADALHWNVRPAHKAAKGAALDLPTDAKLTAAMRYAGRGAALSLGGKPVARIEGGAARLVTDKAGKPTALVGVEQKPQTVTLRLPGQAARRVKLAGNECVTLA